MPQLKWGCFEFPNRSILKDDPVRLLSAICERVDYEELYAAYSEEGRNEYAPRILFKVIAYAYMRKIYSTRGIFSLPFTQTIIHSLLLKKKMTCLLQRDKSTMVCRGLTMEAVPWPL